METEKKIHEVLEKIAPYFQNDGGGLEFVKFEDGVVYIKLEGACAGCPMADLEITGGIKLALTSEVPEVKDVKRV